MSGHRESARAGSALRRLRPSRVWAPVIAVAGVAAAVAWFYPGGASPQTGIADPEDAAQVAQGREVYNDHCAACHGANLEGQPDWRSHGPDGRLPAPPHDASGHTWHHPDDMLFTIVKHGLGAVVAGYESDMPAYAGMLDDHEIRAVLAFIKSTWPDDIRARHAEMNRQAQEAR